MLARMPTVAYEYVWVGEECQEKLRVEDRLATAHVPPAGNGRATLDDALRIVPLCGGRSA